MKVKELTSQHRIMILEDVLKQLESGDTVGGLCFKIEHSAFELFRVWDNANKIIPIFTLENAKKVTEVNDDVFEDAYEDGYWWKKIFSYDFENRIKMVKWMIEQEKSLLNK